MSWSFDARRLTQAAAFLVSCSQGRRMQYLRLLKLLYLADRESIRETQRPITGDDPYAMDFGPVLTRAYDYIKGKPIPGADVWARYIHTDNQDVEVVHDAGTSELSRYDKRLLERVFSEHKNEDGFTLSERSHNFPEWVQVHRNGTSTRITPEILLEALGFGQGEKRDEILQARKEELEFFAGVEKLRDGFEHPSRRVLSP